MDEGHSNHEGAFDPDTIATISRAYESALAALGVRDAAAPLRASLAKYLMQLALAGETDETRLRDAAVADMTSEYQPSRYTGL